MTRDEAVDKNYKYFDTYYQDGRDRYFDVEALIFDIFRNFKKEIKGKDDEIKYLEDRVEALKYKIADFEFNQE